MDNFRAYKSFIEQFFQVLDRETQQPVDFRFNKVQAKYYDILIRDYDNFNGVREIVLKARQQGFSSLILALFTVDFLMYDHSISICVSHRKDATELLFKKVKFYIESYCAKKNLNPKDVLLTDNKNMIENKLNRAMFYIGSAGTKVGGRGGSAKNFHASEASFFADTQKITAQEIITATAQQIPQGKGMIFLESTGGMEDDYYYDEWQRAKRGDSTYRPRFFSWEEFYTKEWVEEKKKDFPNAALWKREYPKDEIEAFLGTGTPYFDTDKLRAMLDKNAQPIRQGRLTVTGEWV